MNRRRVVAFIFIALAVIGLYAAFIVYVPLLDQFALFPSSYHVNAGAAERRTIPFQDGALEIWTAQSQTANKRGTVDLFVLRFYGNADRAERWVAQEADMFGDRAIEVWGVNYPGFGGSTGPARLARIGPASLAAYDEIKKVANQRPIFVFGASMGTTAGLNVAAHRPVSGLILHNPPALRQLILQQHGWWNLWLLAGPLSLKVPADLDSVANAKASHARAIFLLAENDEVVAPRLQSLVAQAYAGEKREIVLRGASHNSPLTSEALRDFHAALDWLLPAAAVSSDTAPAIH
jgi:pimeloyl-ACP methyl ester carboxylesterase